MTWPLRPSLRAAPVYASSYVPKTVDETKLNHNEAPDDVPAEFKDQVLKRLRAMPWHRYRDADARGLREKLAEGLGHPAAGILVGHGANDLLTRVLTALDPDATVVLVEPDYYVYARHAQVLGLAVVRVPLLRDPQGFSLDVDGVLAAAQGPSLLLLSQPNNPTGALYPAQAIDAILQRFPGLVVLDEAYADFAGVSRVADLATRPNLLILRTFSKAEALAGVRLGYLLADPNLATELDKLTPPYPLGELEMAAGLVALDHRDEARTRVAQVVWERERVARALQVLGVTVFPSAGNFLLLDGGTRRGAILQALDRAHLAVRDVDKVAGLQGCLRVSIGRSSANDRFLAAVREALT